MMKLRLLFSIVCCCVICCSINDTDEENIDRSLTPLSVFEDAFGQQKSGFQVQQAGAISAILSDDIVGDHHQRIIVQLGNNQTLLITHNIDIAPRVPNPSKGRSLHFYGEYEWNSEGGVVHWTHKDPDGRHIDGWLEYEGKRYD